MTASPTLCARREAGKYVVDAIGWPRRVSRFECASAHEARALLGKFVEATGASACWFFKKDLLGR